MYCIRLTGTFTLCVPLLNQSSKSTAAAVAKYKRGICIDYTHDLDGQGWEDIAVACHVQHKPTAVVSTSFGLDDTKSQFMIKFYSQLLTTGGIDDSGAHNTRSSTACAKPTNTGFFFIKQ